MVNEIEKKIIRVEFEYDDGSIQRLVGEEAAKWLDACNGQITMARVHGLPFPEFDWKWLKNETDHKVI